MIRTLHEVGMKGTYLNIMKAMYYKPTAVIILGEKLKAFLLRLGARQGCPLSPLLFSMVLEVLATAVRKKIKVIQVGKEEVELLLFPHDMMISIENPKDIDIAKNLLMNSVNSVKFQDAKLMYINMLLFYTPAMNCQSEIKRTIPFVITSKNKIIRYKSN